jgi:hypothetical protein
MEIMLRTALASNDCVKQWVFIVKEFVEISLSCK